MVQANTKIHLTECVCVWQSWRLPAFNHCNEWGHQCLHSLCGRKANDASLLQPGSVRQRTMYPASWIDIASLLAVPWMFSISHHITGLSIASKLPTPPGTGRVLPSQCCGCLAVVRQILMTW